MTQPLSARAEEPPYFKCTSSTAPLHTEGVAYEVHSYENGVAWIATDRDHYLSRLPVRGATFIAYDPWADYKAKQAAYAQQQEITNDQAK